MRQRDRQIKRRAESDETAVDVLTVKILGDLRIARRGLDDGGGDGRQCTRVSNVSARGALDQSVHQLEVSEQLQANA
jgi:hypothetical protein